MSADDIFLDEYRWLSSWLIDSAYPLWSDAGVDRDNGGFHERLSLDGRATGEPRRARLQPRQIFAFSAAREIGWEGPADHVIRGALHFFRAHHYRSDGLIRAVVDQHGHSLDETAVLYDQAFALMGYAAAYASLKEPRWQEAARTLRNEVISAFGQPMGFDERLDRSAPLLANSHMHLLEACLAWRDLGDDEWDEIASRIVELAIDRLLHPVAHVITEFFERDWTPLANDDGRIVEPGHLFEWAWLLLRWAVASNDNAIERHAMRLLDVAEQGVHTQHQVAMNGLALRGDALVVRDGRARLWPQTERIKGLMLAARLTNDSRYVKGATRAMRTLRRYLDVPTPGLWRDMMETDGSFVVESSPASSLYHIVGAVQECQRYAYARFAHSGNSALHLVTIATSSKQR